MRYIFLTLFFVSAPLVAQPAKQDRYQDFVFEPQYSDTAAESIVKTYLLSEKNTLNWHELRQGDAVEVGDNYWTAYEIGLKKEAINAYYAFKDNAEFIEKRQLKKKEQAGWKGVSFFGSS